MIESLEKSKKDVQKKQVGDVGISETWGCFPIPKIHGMEDMKGKKYHPAWDGPTDEILRT